MSGGAIAQGRAIVRCHQQEYPLREHFSDTEIAELGYTIAAIRAWNVINLSLRNPLPEHPAPGM